MTNVSRETSAEGDATGAHNDVVRVAIIAGALSHEREVSLRSGRRVAETLKDLGYHVEIFDVDSQLLVQLEEFSPDVVWPLVHGATGEDGTLQDVLELANYPYIGSRPGSCRLASNKSIAKTVLASQGIDTPHFVTVSRDLFRQVGTERILELVVDRVGLPLVVKPADGGSALGVTVVHDVHDLPGAMVDAFAYGEVALIEKYIDYAAEVAVSVIHDGTQARALPSVEIEIDGTYDFDARYNAGRANYHVPARVSPETEEALRKLALEIFELFKLRDLYRVDTLVDSDGKIWVIDLNVAPGMTETSLFPQSVRGLGDSDEISEVYVGMIKRAIERG